MNWLLNSIYDELQVTFLTSPQHRERRDNGDENAGAIMVLFLFVVLLMDLEEERVRRHRLKLAQILGIVAAAVLLVEVGVFLKAGFAGAATRGPDGSQIIGDTESIGRLLFTQYLFPFEVASVLLLSAIIGSVLLAKLKLRS